MLKRLLSLPKNHSFFLFGARQTGKNTLLQSFFMPEHTIVYNLLKSEEHLRLSANPSLFREEVSSRNQGITHVIVDEIQRIIIAEIMRLASYRELVLAFALMALRLSGTRG